jgi:uncharacterized protein
MERLNSASGTSYNPAKKSKRKDRKKRLTQGAFSSTLESADETLRESSLHASDTDIENNSLETLLDEISELGEKVTQNPAFGIVKKYKAAVKRFMNFVVNNSLSVDQRLSSPNIMRQKKFTLIKIIDSKLDKLAAGILMNQKNTLDILAKIDEIKGLLVDLLN